jgi:hypothetical protein
MPVYVHRGRVDTKFLGILIRAQSMAELESFRSMDRTATLPADQLGQLGIDAFISDMARLTVLDHEVRHFHDALLYPFGAAVLREQVSGAINGLNLVWTIARTSQAANVLPIPLQEWLLLPASKRAWFLEQQGGPGRQLIPPDLPVLDPDDDLADLPRGVVELEGAALIEAGSRIAVSSYRTLEALWRSPHLPGEDTIASTAVLWEVPGTLCQLAAINRIAGEASMQRFADWFFENGPRRYRGGFQLLDAVSPGQPGTIQGRECLALAVWSQMGRFKTASRESSPMWRLDRLWNAGHRGLRWSGEEPFLDLVALWDETIGRSSLADLEDSTRELALLADRYVRRAKPEGNHPGGPRSIAAAALQAYYRAHLAMKEAFLQEPDTFVDPMTYIDRRSIYPQPAVAVSYAEELGEGEWRQDWIDATPSDWRPAIDGSIALGLGALVELMSALFLPSTQTLEPGAQRSIRKYFGLQPLRLPDPTVMSRSP